jgi:hypothetical protein
MHDPRQRKTELFDCTEAGEGIFAVTEREYVVYVSSPPLHAGQTCRPSGITSPQQTQRSAVSPIFASVSGITAIQQISQLPVLHPLSEVG